MGGSDGVAAATRAQVAEFIADLRAWVHRLSVLTERRRRLLKGSERSTGNGDSNNASREEEGGVASPTTTTITTTTPSLADYTGAEAPPPPDVLVLHFQEVGGKEWDAAFTAHLALALRTALLPEAGWTSGLLMAPGLSDPSSCGGVGSPTTPCPGVRSSSTSTTAPATGGGDLSRPNSPAAPKGLAGGGDGTGVSARAAEENDTVKDAESNSTATPTPTSGVGVGEVGGGGGGVSPAADGDTFTAIATVVFLSPRMAKLSSMLSFPHRTYIPIEDDPCSYSGSPSAVFHAGKFAGAGRARKGFLLTSLRLGTCVFNACNVHLFNDDDNVEALKRSPSKFVGRRAAALLEAAAESCAVVDSSEPMFIFGDCNVRLDGRLLAEHCKATRRMDLRPGRKELRCPDSFWPPFSDDTASSGGSGGDEATTGGQQQWLRRQFDREPRQLMDAVAAATGMELAEMPVGFAPTYSRLPATLKDRSGGGEGNGDEEGESRGVRRPITSHATTATGTATATAAGGLGLGTYRRTTPESFSCAEVLAARGRPNFARTRIPAWCDRVFFNPAGLELIAGGRFSDGGGGGCGDDDDDCCGDDKGNNTSTNNEEDADDGARRVRANKREYIYDAVSLLHMDHDGVFLSF